MYRQDTATPAPRVTVFIPAHNVAAYVGAAIDSVLAQTFTDFELLIIDDASDDATPSIIAGYANEPRVRAVYHETNQQRPATRNEGVALARGEFIAMLDADDRCLPGRLARQVKFLDTHPAIDVVGSWWQRIDAAGQALADKRYRRYLTPAAIETWLLFRCAVHNPTVMVRRSVMASVHYDPAFPIAEDYDVWARLIGGQRFAILAEQLTAYREHADQVSMAQAADSLYFRQRVQARQLAALGVQFNERDLRFHSLLYTGRRLFRHGTGHDMDLAYVRWARRWLDELLRANAEQQIYPRGAFHNLCARLWWFVCRKAAREDGLPVWQEFLASRLARHSPVARLKDGWIELRRR